MPRRAAGLTAAGVRTAKAGRYGDGNGLYLLVRENGARFWVWRYTRGGRMREMGLGSVANEIGKAGRTLAEARQEAARLKNILARGVDPLDAEEASRKAAEAAAMAAAPLTFEGAANALLDAREAEWSNPKHRQQWRNTLATYVHPLIGSQPVATVEVEDVRRVLSPIWATKPETASRVKMRILAVLRYARAAGERPTGSSAADIDEALRTLLPKSAPLKRAAGYGHHPALPWQQMPDFMVELRARAAMAARALEFAILTAARTSEVLGATWREIDFRHAVWTVPGARMKSRRQHRVPLSAAATALLEAVKPLKSGPNSPVFPTEDQQKPLSSMALLMLLRRMNARQGEDADGAKARWVDGVTHEPITAHGFRSSFRDWAGEATSTPQAVMEAALAHVNADKVEAAYARGDLFAKRRALMEAWAEYCDRKPATVGHLAPAVLREVG
ncbi:tyrosine-type recombinase/integrase [Acetobacteraceae bacterium H6797]|nr:tyrosine-type recombinase/integrase [Acetobacteraceae bacterium H6797]